MNPRVPLYYKQAIPPQDSTKSSKLKHGHPLQLIREDKRGSISSSSLDILNRLNIPAENWLKITTEFGALFKGAVGVLPALTEHCEHLDRKRRQGVVKLPARVVRLSHHPHLNYNSPDT
ncbi:hypothetical protein [Shewanella sp. SR44-4]|uniref:hypothetical protein n=1 Tax=Shewanella sp. SR44-4 TaxID=2760935 RepID=UPI0038F60FE8